MNELELRMNPKQYVYPDTYTCTYIHIYTYTLFWICLSSKYLCHLCLWRSSIQDRSQKTPIDSKTLWVCWEGAQVGWTSESPNQHLLNDTCSKMFEKHEYIQHEYAGCLWSLLHTESANAQQIIAMQRSCYITYGHHSLVLQCYILPQHMLAFPLALSNFGWSGSLTGLRWFGYVWIRLDGWSTIWRKPRHNMPTSKSASVSTTSSAGRTLWFVSFWNDQSLKQNETANGC